MAEAGTRIEGEEGSNAANPGTDKYEGAARKAGWKPEEDWDGNPEDWVPAKEFVGRQKLFDKIHDLRNQMGRQAQKFEQDMTRISGHFAKVQETEYKRAKKELEGQLAAAKAAGEVEDVAEIAGQIKEVEADQKAAAKEVRQAQQDGPTPDFLEWQKENEWFRKDAEMTADAVAFGTGYAAANPTKSQKEILEHVSKKIKNLYPDKFTRQNDEEDQPRKKVEDKVEGGGTRRTVSSKKSTLSVSDLNDVERTVMQSLIKRNVLKDAAKKNNRTQQEEYLAQLAERKAAE